MSSLSSASVAENRDSYTKVGTERIVYNWTITRFELLPGDAGDNISSPEFYSRDKSEKWSLLFYPCDSSLEGIDYVGLYLARDSPEKRDITVSAELKISKSTRVLTKLLFTHKYEPVDNYGSGQFLERSKLLNTNLFADDEYTITCIIDIPALIITSSFNAINFDLEKNQLSNDLRLLFEDPIFSDFTIIVGNEKFPTHRNILAKRSPVFAAMFKHENLEESRKKEVNIKNIEPDVIKGMLQFIYTDQVTNLKELASGLLEVADRYDLEKLRTMCEKTLYEGLNKKNAAEVLLLADLHRADTLKKCTIKYIVDHGPEMIKSNYLKKIGRNPGLLLELFQQAVLPQEVMKRLKVQRHKSKV